MLFILWYTSRLKKYTIEAPETEKRNEIWIAFESVNGTKYALEKLHKMEESGEEEEKTNK